MQLVIFNALAKYQEQHLQQKRLDHIPLPAFGMPKSQLADMASGKEHGRRLANQALQVLGPKLCPPPPSCQGMLLPQDVKADVLKEMDEVEACNHGGHSAFVGTMTGNLADALLQHMTFEPVPMRSLFLLEVANL